MDILNFYFKDLLFTQVDRKQGYTIYGAAIKSMIGGGKQRYILLFVSNHLAIKKQAKITELPWQNLQTRNLQYSYKLKRQDWMPPRDMPNILFGVVNRTKNYSTYYNPEFPFEIILLHEAKKKTMYQYNNKLTLTSIIETFNSVFNYMGKEDPISFTSYTQDPSPSLVNPVTLAYETPIEISEEDYELV